MSLSKYFMVLYWSAAWGSGPQKGCMINLRGCDQIKTKQISATQKHIFKTLIFAFFPPAYYTVYVYIFIALKYLSKTTFKTHAICHGGLQVDVALFLRGQKP